MNEPTGIVQRLADAVTVVLGRPIGPDENFFDAGLDSLTLAGLHEQVTGGSSERFPITDLFAYPNLRALGRCWSGGIHSGPEPTRAGASRSGTRPAVAQIGRRRRELRTSRGGDGP